MQLKPNGRYQIHDFTPVKEQETMYFLSFLNCARWKDRAHKRNLWT